MKDILRGIDHVIADQLVCLPEISHPIILPGIENLRQDIEEVDVKPRPGLFGMADKLGDINPRVMEVEHLQSSVK